VDIYRIRHSLASSLNEFNLLDASLRFSQIAETISFQEVFWGDCWQKESIC